MRKFLVADNDLKKMEKKKISYYEQFARMVPVKYYDLRYQYPLIKEYKDNFVCIKGNLKDITKKKLDKKSSSGKPMFIIRAVVIDSLTGHKLNISWFNNYGVFKEFQYKRGCDVLVYGILEYHEEFHSFQMPVPIIFTDCIEDYSRLIPVYRGMSTFDEHFWRNRQSDILFYGFEEYIPEKILNACELPFIRDAVFKLHFPKDIKDSLEGYKRFLFEDMLYFAINMKKNSMEDTGNFFYKGKETFLPDILSKIPFSLSEDQYHAILSVMERLDNGKFVNALIQGDVGCGKTIVSFILAEYARANGYQSVIMAPTEVLAKQHFVEYQKYFGDDHVIYLGGVMSVKEKRQLLARIKEEKGLVIIGTHSVVSEDVEYGNLGMVLIDEEQRFGVALKENLRAKAKVGVPFISLSATPIPRSVAEFIYGDYKQIFQIKTMPSGRQSVTTFCYNGETIPQIVFEELQKGHQIYVVCPQIEKDEEEETEKDGLIRHSVEEIKERYEKALSPYGIQIGCLTGKRGKSGSDNTILKNFNEKKIQVLIATTVIEVGVNNPNATVIVIQDADFYGLSTLHQLRGRVKRGSFKPYCVLVSPVGENNPRLNILCQTEDGFEIAKEDLRLRSTGNIIGTEQSGQNKYITSICRYPKMYETVKKVAEWMINHECEKKFMNFMDELKEIS